MISNLSIAEGITVLQPTFYFIIGIVIYAVLVFVLYKRISAKNIFELNLKKYNTAQHPTLEKTVRILLYIVEYIILFPIFAFIWFAILVGLLSLLTQNQTINHILLISIAILAAIRITAYLSEDLAKDLAKMLPLALLGVFIIDFNLITISSSITVLKQSFSLTSTIIYYLIMIIVIETVLRLLYSFTKIFAKEEQK
ncbi:hypothetical protein HN592_01695 [Candidatus Woesearchaeota archaeon]|jgi:hypothetical protein|nr:hypothetical protein [Candidatus Woesearchaeota archaeon]MBT4368604.1 hypothetical protein [Candidatus Woesearchaeota archaeon]MBT4713087.1 hypothetical protein [Candidatus Woesearchaeota archaeon]MBT6639009.1 hypothetical protein [Candidatus Woesearchaeota archaeon]MBT7134208.1 hypothetical protein [Candidatus Woesearchaeota archaeon]